MAKKKRIKTVEPDEIGIEMLTMLYEIDEIKLNC